MEARFTGTTWRGVTLGRATTFQYGPVCIARAARGTGVLPPLFAALRATWIVRCPIGLTFIAAGNTRSLAAHTPEPGLEVIDEWDFDGRAYRTLAFLTTPADS